MKIVTVIGARPQIIKAAQLSPWLDQAGITETVVHSGQHYSPSMSSQFFSEFGLKDPDYNLQVNQVSRTRMISSIMERLEPLLIKERPDACLVFGDTNTTLAGAMVSNFLGIPLIHVEAGLRSGNREMPEETNRILTDQVSDLNLAPSLDAISNLHREGTRGQALLSGDIMLDSLTRTYASLNHQMISSQRGGVLVTIHREETTSDYSLLTEILQGLTALANRHSVRLIRHPRIGLEALKSGLGAESQVEVIEPLAHKEIIQAVLSAEIVLTDSGGLQREVGFLSQKCIILRRETEWAELLEDGFCELLSQAEDIQTQVERVLKSNVVRPLDLPEIGSVGRTMASQIKQFLDCRRV